MRHCAGITGRNAVPLVRCRGLRLFSGIIRQCPAVVFLFVKRSGAALDDSPVAEDCGYGSENAAYIGFQADRPCIFSVKTGFFGYRKLVPAVYLGKPRKAGTDVVCAVFVTLFYEVVLVPQCRTRSDDCHLTGDYVEQLRKLVKRGFA